MDSGNHTNPWPTRGEQTQRLLDPDAVANRLMEEWMP